MDFKPYKAPFDSLNLSGTGWYHVREDEGQRLAQELRRELAPGHLLEDKPIEVIARRHDRDDILLIVFDGNYRYVGVHLTWATQHETDPKWPWTWQYRDLQHFIDDTL